MEKYNHYAVRLLGVALIVTEFEKAKKLSLVNWNFIDMVINDFHLRLNSAYLKRKLNRKSIGLFKRHKIDYVLERK